MCIDELGILNQFKGKTEKEVQGTINSFSTKERRIFDRLIKANTGLVSMKDLLLYQNDIKKRTSGLIRMKDLLPYQTLENKVRGSATKSSLFDRIMNSIYVSLGVYMSSATLSQRIIEHFSSS